MVDNTVAGRFWIERCGKAFLGKGKAALLRNIHSTGSISQAAKLMKMSYKAAWDDVDSMNNLSDKPLVVAEKGKRSGSKLTESAFKALTYFELVESRFNQFLCQISKEHIKFAATVKGFRLNNDLVHYEITTQEHTFYSSMSARFKRFNIGENVLAIVFPEHLLPVSIATAENIDIDNIFIGVVSDQNNNTILLNTDIGEFTVMCGAKASTTMGSKLAVVCSSYDICLIELPIK